MIIELTAQEAADLVEQVLRETGSGGRVSVLVDEELDVLKVQVYGRWQPPLGTRIE